MLRLDFISGPRASQHGKPLVDVREEPTGGVGLGKGTEFHLGRDVPALRRLVRQFFVQFLGNFDEAAAVDLAKPLEVPQLAPELEEGAHELLGLVIVEVGGGLQSLTISVMECFDMAPDIGELLVEERIDLFQVSVKGEKELCPV